MSLFGSIGAIVSLLLTSDRKVPAAFKNSQLQGKMFNSYFQLRLPFVISVTLYHVFSTQAAVSTNTGQFQHYDATYIGLTPIGYKIVKHEDAGKTQTKK